MGTDLETPNLDEMLGALDESADVCFALDRDLRLIYRNPAWDRFALENGAPALASHEVLKTDLRQVIGRDLIAYYTAAFEKVERERELWECNYECSSPHAFRKFRMQIQLLAPSGYLVRNHLLVEHPHLSSADTGTAEYLNSNSLIVLCMHCRCSQRAQEPYHWDFVPGHLEPGLTNVTHSLCPICLEYFYPKEKDAV